MGERLKHAPVVYGWATDGPPTRLNLRPRVHVDAGSVRRQTASDASGRLTAILAVFSSARFSHADQPGAGFVVSTPPLTTRFKNQVERRLGGAPEAGESRLHDYLAQTFFTGLGAESESDLLRQRGGRAYHGRSRVENPPDRIQIVLDAVVREWLYQQPGAVGRQRFEHVPGRANRISHVMQTVKKCYQIVGTWVGLGARHLEADPAGDTGIARRFARPFN